MASITVQAPPQFPVGTTLQVYADPGGDIPPSGVAVTSAVVGSDSRVKFTGLTPGIAYQAGALFSGKWIGMLIEIGEAVPTTGATLLNVVDYGALPGLPDATDGLVRARADLSVNGGMLYFPQGTYNCNADQLNFDDTHSVLLKGVGGLSAGAAQASRLAITTNGARGISARSALGFGIQDLAVGYTGASGFTGTLIDLGQSGALTDGQMTVFQNCYIGGGSSARGAAKLVNLDKALNFTAIGCNFNGGQTAIYGKSSNASYSNVIGFIRCRFGSCEQPYVRNGGQSWAFYNCGFERLVDGTGAGAGAGAYARDSGVTANGVSFDSCWFGDASIAGIWIDFGGNGLRVEGGYMSGGLTGIQTANAARAWTVKAVNFFSQTNGIIVGTNNIECEFWPNEFNGVTNNVVLADTPIGIGQSSSPETQPTFYGGMRIERSTAAGVATRIYVGGETNARQAVLADGTRKRGLTGASSPDVVDAIGNGSPEGVVTGAPGSTYSRRDGGAGTCFYVKESGTGNTGWVAK